MSEVTQTDTYTWVVRQHDTVKPETLVERTEFISSILGSAWEGYEWWQSYEYAEGYEWDTIPTDDDTPFLTITAQNPDADEDEDEDAEVTATLSVRDIIVAYIEASSALRQDIGYESYGDGDGYLDIDADAGDVIIQFAVYGTHIFG